MNQEQMAQALADHYPTYRWSVGNGEWIWTCQNRECPFWSESFTEAITHQGAAIAPLVAATRVEALRQASDAYSLETAYGAEHTVLWLKDRATQMEAETDLEGRALVEAIRARTGK